MQKTIEIYGKIDILVNNAGTIIEKPFTEIIKEGWDQFVTLDAFSCLRAHAACPAIHEKNRRQEVSSMSLH